MKMKFVLSNVAVLLALHAGAACADARSGFSLNAGLANNKMDATVTVNPGPAQFSYNTTYTGTGLSLGLDYQIAVSPRFSINPFLMSSSESVSGMVSGTTAGHAIWGIQLRYWVGDVFVGGHLGRYTEALLNSNLPTTRASGNGGGLVLGWEAADSGLYVMGQLDSAKWQYVDANVKLSGFRASVGYRWK